MKSKSIFLMAVSLGFGLVAAIGITQVMGRSNEAPTKVEPKLPVLVAIQDININDELTPEMFIQDEWPKRLVPEGVATTFDELEGMVATARIPKKGTVALSNLVDKTAIRGKTIPKGFKVIGMKLGAEDHLYGLLEAGDLVDIMLISRGSRNSQAGSARTFLRKVTVFSIGDKTKKNIEQTPTAKGSTVVGLLVTERQAEKIVLAEKVADLKLALRGEEDALANQQSPGTTQSDLDGVEDEGDAYLKQLLASSGVKPQPPVEGSDTKPADEPEPKGDTWTVTVHTAEGPTVYTFDKDSKVAQRNQGYANENVAPVLEPLNPEKPATPVNPVNPEKGSGTKSNLDDGIESGDTGSLIEDLDSEPGS